MKLRYKIYISLCVAFLTILIAIGTGSVSIPVSYSISIFFNRLFHMPLLESIPANIISILWNIRIPRVLISFFIGSALAVSGTVMQSLLKNPLASSFTLGVSSGASLGVAIIIVFGIQIPFLGMFTYPFVGSLFGLVTVLLAMAFSAQIDRNLSNQTIVLIGMILSLFVNAILTFLTTFSNDRLKQLIFWQMGSFSSKNWSHVFVVFPIITISILLLLKDSKILDIMTFGEEQALSLGIELKAVKLRIILITSFLTGAAVAFTGVIGFVDLAAPHIVRKIFGSSHHISIPMSAIIGGIFMTIADLIARTTAAPIELPVGAVTALIGAPFFAYIYFNKQGRLI